jgi:hypothetical protein
VARGCSRILSTAWNSTSTLAIFFRLLGGGCRAHHQSNDHSKLTHAHTRRTNVHPRTLALDDIRPSDVLIPCDWGGCTPNCDVPVVNIGNRILDVKATAGDSPNPTNCHQACHAGQWSQLAAARTASSAAGLAAVSSGARSFYLSSPTPRPLHCPLATVP